ncbi:hypothetical protein [Bradyrhizobium sp. SZCCHNR3015]|uniref:phage tail fiber protein n=1 Tax=Bradyrhizobium sp. SZCCHNR3015 TaxID=3057395 RepID=UPI0029164AA5|nr:hypothetical protein [Bradyrhizobium sp. SZCCHNR3015]
MTGLSNYSAFSFLNYITGQAAMPALPAVYLALFTAVGTDAGTGFTEVSGGAYARMQIAGSVTTNSATTTSSAVIGHAAVPSWVVAGMQAYDATTGHVVGTVQSTTSTTVTLTANAAFAIGSGDAINYSAFPNATGTSPASSSNGATIAFPTATANWGSAMAWGLYDALSGGNLLFWDYMGYFPWLPATVSAASPGVITAHAHGFANGDSFVFTTEYGGTAPTFAAGSYTGLQTVAGVTADTFSVTGVNTSATGNGALRKVGAQSIPSGVTASFSPSTFTLSLA